MIENRLINSYDRLINEHSLLKFIRGFVVIWAIITSLPHQGRVLVLGPGLGFGSWSFDMNISYVGAQIKDLFYYRLLGLWPNNSFESYTHKGLLNLVVFILYICVWLRAIYTSRKTRENVHIIRFTLLAICIKERFTIFYEFFLTFPLELNNEIISF